MTLRKEALDSMILKKREKVLDKNDLFKNLEITPENLKISNENIISNPKVIFILKIKEIRIEKILSFLSSVDLNQIKLGIYYAKIFTENLQLQRMREIYNEGILKRLQTVISLWFPVEQVVVI